MKRSSSSPPTFMATPCRPVGRPKRNSDRMTVQSGASGIVRENRIGVRLANRRARPTRPAPTLLMTAPSAAPTTPSRGNGPQPVTNPLLSARCVSVRPTPR